MMEVINAIALYLDANADGDTPIRIRWHDGDNHREAKLYLSVTRQFAHARFQDGRGESGVIGAIVAPLLPVRDETEKP